jgi:hypothetical protein
MWIECLKYKKCGLAEGLYASAAELIQKRGELHIWQLTDPLGFNGDS